MKLTAQQLLHVLQMADSTFPVGTFSFSNGLESAAGCGLVHDAASLEEFTRSVARQAAFTDGVAALHACRATLADDYEGVLRADRALMECKMNHEARLMLRRMGRKMAELADRLMGGPLMTRWLADITAEATPGSYPVAQGVAYALAGVDEEALYAASQYGTINMVLSAALRCVRVSHYDTQGILLRLAAEVPGHYEAARGMRLDDMWAFAPEVDVMAAMHEKGPMRMFMN